MVTDTFLPEIGGGEVHVYELSKALSGYGHHVEIFTASSGPDIIGGFRVYRAPCLSGGDRKAVWHTPRGMFELRKFMQSKDMIHAHYTFYLSTLCALLRIVSGKPLIVSLHGLGTLDSYVGGSRLRQLYRYLSFKYADIVITTSEEMGGVARRFTSERKIFFVPSGVDSTRAFTCDSQAKKAGNEGKLIVLSNRRLHPKNGVQYLIEAIPRILEKVNNVEFRLIGSGKLEGYLRKRVRDLKIEEYVNFLGMLPNADVPEYLAMADIVVFPSSAESTSIACLEAMAMGKAVIASALSAYKDLLGEDERGILVNLFDREYSDYHAPVSLPEDKIRNLVNAVVYLAERSDIRRKIGLNARAFVAENYDWRIIAARVEELYKLAVATIRPNEGALR